MERRFARTKSRQPDLLLKFVGHRVKRRVHRRGVHFHPHQLFAETQIFNRHIHNQSLRRASAAPVPLGTGCRGAVSVKA